MTGHRTQWGLSKGMARPSMYMGGLIGGMAGFLMAYQQSTGRAFLQYRCGDHYHLHDLL